MKNFSERVIEAALSIPKGRITTYGRIARACGGGSMASRSITGILSKAHKEKRCNIPFHRIVYSNGTIWIGENKKKRIDLYKREGIALIDNKKIKNFNEIIFDFK